MIALPGPDRTHQLKVSLALIEEIESAHGSLYLVAQRLLDGALPLTAIIGILKNAYRHAGCAPDESELNDFLLRQPCAELLAELLVAVLAPLEGAGTPSVQFLEEMSARFPDHKGEKA